MRRVMFVTCLGVLWALLLAVPSTAAQQATQEVIIDKGTVLKVMGNTIIVRHDTGDVKKYTVPTTRSSSSPTATARSVSCTRATS